MFGFLRTTLALLVVASHLYGYNFLGIYAVVGFYVLSGYLMTRVMQTQYGYTRAGLTKFAINRFLRLYPPYLVAIGLALIAIFWIGENIAKQYHGAMYFPRTATEILRNLFIVFIPYNTTPRLSPATWALTVELCFYILIAAGLSRNAFVCTAWFVVSAAYTGLLLATGREFEARYFPVTAASLPFAIGSMIYHVGAWGLFDRYWHQPPIFMCYTALGLNMYASHSLHAEFSIGFYVNLILMTVTIVACLQNASRVSEKCLCWDRWIGNLSYPIYLVHWQIGLIVSYLLFSKPVHGLMPQGVTSFLVSLPVITLAAIGIHYSIEYPLERIRCKVRQSLPSS